jgi:hypothetical protein
VPEFIPISMFCGFPVMAITLPALAATSLTRKALALPEINVIMKSSRQGLTAYFKVIAAIKVKKPSS